MGTDSTASGNPFAALTASNKLGGETVGIIDPLSLGEPIPSLPSLIPSSDTDEMAIDPQHTVLMLDKKLESLGSCIKCSKDKDRILALLEELHHTEKTHRELLETHLATQSQLTKLDLAHSLLRNDYDRIRSKLSYALEDRDDLRRIIDNKERVRSISPKRRRKESSNTIASYDEPLVNPGAIRETRGIPKSSSNLNDINSPAGNQADTHAVMTFPHSEQDVLRDITTATIDNDAGRAMTQMLSKLRTIALSTPPHALSPAMRTLLARQWSETSRFSLFTQNNPADSNNLYGNSTNTVAPKSTYSKLNNSGTQSLPTQETINLLAKAPGPSTFSLKLTVVEATKFMLYKSRIDDIYVGCDVIKLDNGGYAMDTRQTRGMLFARQMAPARGLENCRARHAYLFHAACLIGISGEYSRLLYERRITLSPSAQLNVIPFHYVQGTEISRDQVVSQFASCGVTPSFVNEIFPWGRSCINNHASRRSVNEVIGGLNHISSTNWKTAKRESDTSIALGSPPSAEGDTLFYTSGPVVPYEARGDRQSSSKVSVARSRPAKPSNTKVEQTTQRLSGFSFNNIPSFIDATHTSPDLNLGLNSSAQSTFPGSSNGHFVTGMSYRSAPSVTAGSVSYSGIVMNSGFGDDIDADMARSDDDDAAPFVDAH
ncbi:hypothetical protein C8J56DRAFT_1058667 [Mycena floridula]|nr:hypothetical protein C8J56DRAFT_1058667 [Mycena floridula]